MESAVTAAPGGISGDEPVPEKYGSIDSILTGREEMKGKDPAVALKGDGRSVSF
jgi:hypothetical protein